MALSRFLLSHSLFVARVNGSSVETRRAAGAVERSFVAIKPDGVERRLVGEIISRFERKSLRLSAIKVLKPPMYLAKQHYEMHEGQEYYNRLISFFTSGPIVAMVWEGPNAVALIRKLVGATHPAEAVPGSIRGDFAYEQGQNLVHSSDSLQNAQREIGIWFEEADLVAYK